MSLRFRRGLFAETAWPTGSSPWMMFSGMTTSDDRSFAIEGRVEQLSLEAIDGSFEFNEPESGILLLESLLDLLA